MVGPAEHRVQLGAGWLDNHFPRWWTQIDITGLRIRDINASPLAQASGLTLTAVRAKFGFTKQQLVKHGFHPDTEAPSEELHTWWIVEWTKRMFADA